MSDGGRVAANSPPPICICLIVISARFAPESANFEEKWPEMATYADGADRLRELLSFSFFPAIQSFSCHAIGGSLVSMIFVRQNLLLALVPWSPWGFGKEIGHMESLWKCGCIGVVHPNGKCRTAYVWMWAIVCWKIIVKKNLIKFLQPNETFGGVGLLHSVDSVCSRIFSYGWSDRRHKYWADGEELEMHCLMYSNTG